MTYTNLCLRNAFSWHILFKCDTAKRVRLPTCWYLSPSKWTWRAANHCLVVIVYLKAVLISNPSISCLLISAVQVALSVSTKYIENHFKILAWATVKNVWEKFNYWLRRPQSSCRALVHIGMVAWNESHDGMDFFFLGEAKRVKPLYVNANDRFHSHWDVRAITWKLALRQWKSECAIWTHPPERRFTPCSDACWEVFGSHDMLLILFSVFGSHFNTSVAILR